MAISAVNNTEATKLVSVAKKPPQAKEKTVAKSISTSEAYTVELSSKNMMVPPGAGLSDAEKAKYIAATKKAGVKIIPGQMPSAADIEKIKNAYNNL